MPHPAVKPETRTRRSLNLARVLLVHGELASRLAVQTILIAAGYAVDVAATPSEAFAKLDEGRYELVLSSAEFGSSSSGRDVLSYARVKEYQPATALVTASERGQLPRSGRARHRFSIRTENVPAFLGDVAELIGLRASRRSRVLRHAV
jgi:CheY-like chemotaxis protein